MSRIWQLRRPSERPNIPYISADFRLPEGDCCSCLRVLHFVTKTHGIMLFSSWKHMITRAFLHISIVTRMPMWAWQREKRK